MKKIIPLFLTFLIILPFIINNKSGVYAGNPKKGSSKKWTTKNLFEQKNFIENKGQIDDNKLPNKQQVLYVASIDEVIYYFTKNGYTISHRERQVKSRKEMEEEEQKTVGKKENEKELNFKIVEKFHEVKWENANPHTELIAENQVTNYYSYSDLKSHDKQGTLIAHAYTRLTYKEIYPHTNIVFEFPKDSTGIKYSIYLYPGADVEKIRMIFPGEKIKLTKNNDVEINSAFGNIIDHHPVSYTAENKYPVKSRFKLANNKAGFELENAPQNKTIIIDPWTITPAFDTSSAAFDIDYDNVGNVYVYGGPTGGPFALLKYNAGGSLLWSYTPTLFTSTYQYYGDFAVDRNSNTAYIVEGFNYMSGAEIVKINSSATVSAFYAGDPNFVEMWRIAFSRCTNQAVVAGGGTSSFTYQTCYLDTNLTSLSPVSYVSGGLPPGNDVALLTLDNYGNCYQVSASNFDGLYDNQLVKMPLPTLFPLAYNVNTGYSFIEVGSVLYYGLVASNGYNGLTTSTHYVYSYDGYALKKWDGTTGNPLAYKRINYPRFDTTTFINDSSKMYWGGISADDCGNIFLADSNIVRQYDSTLSLINSYPMPGVITDVNLSITGQLYVCGLGFVSSLTPTGMTNCTIGSLALTHSVVDATCTTGGSATVVVADGIPPYTITWNTVPIQYGANATNLPAGTYTVVVADASCLRNRVTDTVTINIQGGPVADFTMVPAEVAFKDEVITFSNQSTGETSVSWDFADPASGAANSSIVSNPSHAYAKEGSYCIRLIASTTSGCADTAIKCIEIINRIELPNVFTPNGDHKNDEFYIQNLQLGIADLRIYNRWGNLIYSSPAYNNDWDGSGASDGTYYYTMNYPVDGKTYTGFVQLIK